MWKKYGLLALVVGIFLANAPAALAVKFDLVAPSGTLTRGQDVTFTINIDTQGASVTTITTGMTYDTQYLQYESAAAGAAMSALTVDTSQGTGKLVFNGSNPAGFTGSGVYATVTFKLIAQSSGETELCTLWQPTTTPTTAPAVCNATCTSNSDCSGGMYCYVTGGQASGFCRNQTCPEQANCTCIQPTSAPLPTALPQSGFELPQNTGMIAGSLLLAIAAGVYVYTRNTAYTPSAKEHEHKGHHTAHKKAHEKKG